MPTRAGESQEAFQKILPELATLSGFTANSHCSGCHPVTGLAALFSSGFQCPGSFLAKKLIMSPTKLRPEDGGVTSLCFI